MKPASPEALAALEELEEQQRSAMSPKTALLAGLVLGVAAMVAVIGFLAWRDKQRSDLLPPPPPTITFVNADGGAVSP